MSAKFLIPRQLVGWSWRIRNLQQASRTELIWRIDEAGRRTWQDRVGFISTLSDCQTVRSVYLNVVLAHRELSSVGEVHQQGERQGVDIVDGDVSQVLLRHVV